MRTFSERTHAKQVDNFRDLINFIRSYGSRYNPSKNSLKLPQLEALLLEGQTLLEHVITEKSLYEDMVSKRALAFSGLRIFSTRLINALDSTDASPNKMKNAYTYHRKLQGKRATTTSNLNAFNTAQANPPQASNLTDPTTPITTTEPTNTTTPNNNTDSNISTDNTISASQQSYTQQLHNFSGLIGVIKTEASYMPNEVDLQIATLEAMKMDLISKNDAVSAATVTISAARIARNKKLYTDEHSIYEVAKEVKKYVKSIYGANSPEFSQIKALEFNNK